MDPVRKLVVDRIAALGLDMAGVSRRLGLNHAYIQQFVTKGKPQVLPEETRRALAGLLGVDEQLLRIQRRPRGNAAALSSAANSATNSPGERIYLTTALREEEYSFDRPNVRPAPDVRLARPADRPENVPVRGTVRGGHDGSFELNLGDAIEYVRRPLSLIGKGEIYALYVEGDSMAPRYEPGEIVLVYAQRPPVIGRDVVIQVRPRVEGDNPQAYLKRLVRKSDREITVEQFNPRKTRTFKTADVLSIHLVLTRDEMV
jgi:phage repressor protein C with HTH and peptisase S24 domain